MGRDPATIPQICALYKEVQDYYEQGMHVPDVVPLLLADDNWGRLQNLKCSGGENAAAPQSPRKMQASALGAKI